MFLDVAESFEKVWNDGLYHKLKLHLPFGRDFRIKQEDAFSVPKSLVTCLHNENVLAAFNDGITALIIGDHS